MDSRTRSTGVERKHRATFDEKFLGRYRNLHAELLSRQPQLEASGVDVRLAHLLMESGSLAGPDPIGALITHLDQLIDRMGR